MYLKIKNIKMFILKNNCALSRIRSCAFAVIKQSSIPLTPSAIETAALDPRSQRVVK